MDTEYPYIRLIESDKKMARFGEDLLALLEAKGVLSRTELPQEAQDLIADREAHRAILLT